MSSLPDATEQPQLKEVLAQELILDNFKSFARKTTIPLMEGFTTISGPNGSGKSNLLDSILFCLGLSTSKSLRAERLPDLINNRSTKNEARVTLKLKVKGQDAPIEFSRMVRVGKNDYHSAYYLDGKPVSLQVIHEKLAELNINPNGHNIIMQGDVTRILTCGPVERRKIIDDLAGVGEFDERIDSAKREMGEAERHMDATRILAMELTSRLEALRGEREQALAFLGIKSEKDRLEKTLLSRRHQDATRNLATVRTRLSGIRTEFGLRNDEMLKIDADMAGCKEMFLQLDKEIQEIGDKERMGGFAELEDIKDKLQRSISYVEYVEKLNVEHSKRQDELKKKFNEADARRNELTTLLAKDAGERQTLESQLASKREALQALQKRMESVSEANARSLMDLPTLRKQLEEARDLESSLSFEDQKLATEAVGLEASHTQYTAEIARLKERHSTLKAGEKKKQEELKAAEAKVQELTYELFDARTVVKERKTRLTDLQEQYQKALGQYSKLEGIKQATENSGMAGLSAVLNSGIKGIHGRVADLAEIPEPFRIAIESAAGRRLDFVVVEDENVAVAAIDMLKQRRLGRVTFLPLTKIRGISHDPVSRTAGVHGLCIDLVKFENRYRDIFAFVMGDTLVIDNIRVGLAMMGRYRMVSLEGDLLEKTGAMTGGAPPPPRRAMPELDLAAKKRALDQMEQEARTIRNQLPGLEESLTLLEEKLQNARRLVMDLNAIVGQGVRDLELLVAEQAKAAAEIEKSVKGLTRIARDRETLTREREKANEVVQKRQDVMGASENGLAQGASKELSEEVRFIDGQMREVDEKLRVVKDHLRERELEREFNHKNMGLFRKEYDELGEKLSTLSEQVQIHRKEQEVLRGRQAELSAVLEAVSHKLVEKRKAREEQATVLESLTVRRDEVRTEQIRREAEIREQSARESQLAMDLQRMTTELAEKGIDPELFVWKGAVKELEQSINGLIEQLERMGAVNLLAIDQAVELEARLGQLNEKLATLERERQELLDRMAHFGELKRKAFLTTFEGVQKNFIEIYTQLSSGQGELVLEDPKDPFNGGLIIRACPKGKDMKRIEALSGGEKSLAALAFVFAFQSYRPAPFYIFDEVDMFLDNPNTERLAAMIRQQANSTQFIVVSLKKCMIERSHRTVGVYSKDGGVSQVAGLDLVALEQERGLEVGAGTFN